MLCYVVLRCASPSRYCNHDLGHAMMSVHFGASLQGWSTANLAGVGDAQVHQLLGLDRAEDFAAFHKEPEFGEVRSPLDMITL